MPADLPSGTVTLLFTDIEGSTRMLQELGREAYVRSLTEHRRLLRDAFTSHGGVEVEMQGDSFFFAFPYARDAVAAAVAGQRTLAEHDWESQPIRVRIGLHTGEPMHSDGLYAGMDVHQAARVMSAAHGGQVLISQRTAELVGEELANGIMLLDLGEHRLKDLTTAQRLYQAGEGTFPPLKTISNTNLPRPASSFVGRDRELAEVLGLLGSGARLVTLTGPGGSGKTRLAIEAASALLPEYHAGVFWIGLAPLRDPSLVTETIARTLGATDGLSDHIGDRTLLIVLDNLEQVIGAASELAELLARCPNLMLLVTSRELLRVSGEIEYPVPPLAEPEAVALFCARAQMEASDDVRELCRRLDALPLAVELAAARTKALSPGQILERLANRLDLLRGGRDADPRQETLRATINWSYDLLNTEEQRLFARLSVFAGGCTLEAAEKVADADLDTLQSLVEKSLIRFTDKRYWMLETIREYAAQQLEVAGTAEELAQHHAEHFRALADAAEPHIQKRPEEWLDLLEPEHSNFRAALDRLEASGESQDALWLAGALAGFWDAGGHVEEGRRRLESLLRSDDRPTGSRARALGGAALLARLSGDAEGARLNAGEALLLYRDLGDLRGTAYSGVMLGLGHADSGDFAKARHLFNDSALLFREAGDDDDALFATRLLGWMYEELGDSERALAVHEENLARARALANKQFEAQSLGALASIAIEQGRPDDAFPKMKEVLLIDRDRGAPIQIGLDLVRFARVLSFAGCRHTDATRLLASAEAIRETTGAGTPQYLVRNIEQTLAVIRTRLDDAALSLAWEEGLALTADEAIQLALSCID